MLKGLEEPLAVSGPAKIWPSTWYHAVSWMRHVGQQKEASSPVLTQAMMAWFGFFFITVDAIGAGDEGCPEVGQAEHAHPRLVGRRG